MDIVVDDTATAMAELLTLPLSERPEALTKLLNAFDSTAARLNMDLVAMHHRAGGFRVDREDPRYLPALRMMTDAGLWRRMREALEAAWAHQKAAVPGIRHRDEPVRAVLVLGNPDDEHLMKRIGGYYGMSGGSPVLFVVAWPTPENLEQIAYCAVHEMHHYIRHANVEWNPATVTVGDHVVSEGLAEAFVREVGGPAAVGAYTRAVTGEALDDAYATIAAAIDLQGMQHLTPYVLGDATAKAMGQTPAGVPDMAGYGVGLRIVDAHLAKTGLTAAQSTVLPAAEILANAGVTTAG
jgi:Predicted Zn-dependent protease